jgi:hypothetical protein
MLPMTLSMLCALTAPARAGDCSKSADGASVTCTSEGFSLLTREAILARGEAKTCGIKLNECKASIEAREVAVQACEAKLASIPPPEPPRSLVRPLSGYGVGVLSAVLLVTGIAAPLPEAARISLGGVGLIGLAGGAVLVVW